jgi:predicted ATPase
MKELDVKIENFGMIKKANLKIKPFTVIAGKNGSGKSFVTRGLYSFFNSLNKDHLSIEVDLLISQIERSFKIARYNAANASSAVTNHIINIFSSFESLKETVDDIFHSQTLLQQLELKNELNIEVALLNKVCNDLINHIDGIKKYENLGASIIAMQSRLKSLDSFIQDPSNEAMIEALGSQFKESLISNFQVSSLSKLKNNTALPEEDMAFHFGGGVGEVLVTERNTLKFDLSSEGVDEFQKIENVVYLESPVYWKIKDVLSSYIKDRENPFLRRLRKNQKDELKKIPGYILDTLSLIDTSVVSLEDKELSALALDLNKKIGGSVQVSETGDLQFVNIKPNGETSAIDLHQSATGAVSLGIISLLLDKNIIVSNSILIIDEPEVNLHPAWQQVLIFLLYKLSCLGVQIIIASHSLDMMEMIEKMMELHEKSQKNPDNHFSIIQLEDGVSINEDAPAYKKLDEVKGDLGMPLFDLLSGSFKADK